MYRTTGGDEFIATVEYLGVGDGGERIRVSGVSIEDLQDGR